MKKVTKVLLVRGPNFRANGITPWVELAQIGLISLTVVSSAPRRAMDYSSHANPVYDVITPVWIDGLCSFGRFFVASWILVKLGIPKYWLCLNFDISGFDIIHVSEEFWGFSLQFALKKRAHQKFFLASGENMVNSPKNSRLMQRVVSSIVLSRIDGATGTSDSAVRRLKVVSKLRVPICLVTNSASPEYVATNTRYHVPKFGTSERKAVLFVGRWSEQKGITRILACAKALREAEFWVVGPGRPGIHVPSNVIIHGTLNNKDLGDLYRRACITVLPSRRMPSNEEQLGMCLIESLFCGTPVVGTKIGGIPTVIRHGVNGILTEDSTDSFIEGVKAMLELEVSEYIAYSQACIDTYDEKFSGYSVSNSLRKFYEI